MTQHYRFPSGELAPGLVLPPEIQRRLRLALASIEAANSHVNCLIAQATAQGVCLGLDMGHVLARSDIDRMESWSITSPASDWPSWPATRSRNQSGYSMLLDGLRTNHRARQAASS